MKNALKGLFILMLAVGAADARVANSDQQTAPTFGVPEQLSFQFELENSPALATADSWWEISIQLRIADQSVFANWLAQQKDGKTNIPEPGILLRQRSF